MKLFLAALIGLSATMAVFWPSGQKTVPNHTNAPAPPPPGDKNPEELGAVQWIRDLDEGKALAEKSGKPLLILFQEVPGCSNCTRYGNVTLSHPLVVEAIESYFVPVCIYNNKGGKDAAALKIFGESAWNNPVVRIVRSSDYRDITTRIDDFRSTAQLVSGIRDALGRTDLNTPLYFLMLQEESIARESGLETATFSMYCFWAGESLFGNIKGVIATEPGYQDGKEVVKVEFNPMMVSKKELEAISAPKGVLSCSKNEGFRSDSEPKYYLAHTPWRAVPMTSMQACQANSLLNNGKSPEPLFSPRRLELYNRIKLKPEKDWKNFIGATDLAKAWEGVMSEKN